VKDELQFPQLHFKALLNIYMHPTISHCHLPFMAGFLSNKQQGQRGLLSAPFIFYPKIKTASSIKQGDPSVSQLTSGIHVEIFVWGSASASMDLGTIRKRAQR